MSETSGTDPQYAVVPGAVTQRFSAAPVATVPQGPDVIASELGAMAIAMEDRRFTAETLAARLEDDPEAKQIAAIAALALALRDLLPSDRATIDRILAEGPRAKRGRRT
jgi:hypothetical protein